MDPVIEEICRAREVQPHALRRWATYLRETIQPQLDELAEIKSQPEKRGPGRPRKVTAEDVA